MKSKDKIMDEYYSMLDGMHSSIAHRYDIDVYKDLSPKFIALKRAISKYIHKDAV